MEEEERVTEQRQGGQRYERCVGKTEDEKRGEKVREEY